MAHERGVDEVRATLAPHGYQVQELDSSTRTAPLAADALGVPVGAIVKSLLFLADDRPVLVLVSGDRRVDSTRLGAHLGARQVRLARPSEVLDLTGFRVGGVPPVGHRHPLPTVIDAHLDSFDRIYAAAGHERAVFGLTPAGLLDLTGGAYADVTH